jgi:hypothetical protein
MDKSSTHRLFIWVCCIILGLIIAFSIIYANAKAAHGAGTIQPGHYTVTTTFIAGPRAGQSESGTYDIQAIQASRPQSYSLTVYFPSVGTGYGTIADNGAGAYILTFREVIPNVGEVQVAQVVTRMSNARFTSQGYGELYVNNVPQQSSRNTTISVATLAPTN